jgi:RNA recognition motif-containing protein
LFIGKLPTTVTEELLRQIFAPYGNIEKLNILKGTLAGPLALAPHDLSLAWRSLLP